MRLHYEDIRLKYRYFQRRIGNEKYQLHQICLPNHKLIYIPIPKNISTTIKHALFEIQYQKKFNKKIHEFSKYDDHHDFYLKRSDAFTKVDDLLKKRDYTCFAIVREPVKRLISCYRNRVIDLNDLELDRKKLQLLNLKTRPCINSFILNLEKYRAVNKSIAHHTKPQAVFIGGTLKYLDEIYTFDDLKDLKKMLRQYKPELKFYRRKMGGTKVSLGSLSKPAIEKAIELYRDDYSLLSGYFDPRQILFEYRSEANSDQWKFSF